MVFSLQLLGIVFSCCIMSGNSGDSMRGRGRRRVRPYYDELNVRRVAPYYDYD